MNDYVYSLLSYIFYAAVQTEVKAQPMKPISKDVDILARTIYGEARGEGYAGMQAVANVIINRSKYVGSHPWYGIRWGYTLRGICQKASQFSVWNRNDVNYRLITTVTEVDSSFRTAIEIAKMAVAGTLPDNVKGSTYYHTRAIHPYWVGNATPVASVGNQVFYQTSQIA